MWIVTLFFSLILVAVLQMWIFSRFGFKRLTYRRWFTPNVVNEGDTVTMSETIRNEKLLPLPWVRIEAGISTNLVFGTQQNTAAASDTAQETLQTSSQAGARQYHRSIFSLGP